MKPAAQTGERHISTRGHPVVLLGLFFAIFALQLVIALMGYAAFGLATEYSSRNLVHLDAITEAQTVLDTAQIGTDMPVAPLRDLVTTARDQTAWCVANMRYVGQTALAVLGAENALRICQTDLDRADYALELLRKLEAPPDANAPLTERPFALSAQLGQILRLMLEDSRAFAPEVIAIRERLTRAVHIWTVGAGVFMLIVFSTLSQRFLGNWRDLSLQSQEIQRQSLRFKLAMQSNVDGLGLFDSDLRLLNCNERFLDLLTEGKSQKAGLGLVGLLETALRAGQIQGFNGNGSLLLSSIRGATGQAGVGGFQVELTGDRHALLTVAETGLGDTILLARDITLHVRSDRAKEAHAREMREINARIEESAKRDPLTGLANRRGLDNALLNREGDPDVTIIRIDLDRFKQVNDVFGHEAGDHVLVHVSDLLRRFCRTADFPVRVGGDEFLVLCARGTSAADAISLCDRILEKVQEPVIYNGKHLLFGASFGVASSAGTDEDHGTLLRSADAALYLAKNSGRSTVKLFTPALREAVNRDRALAETFLPSLQKGEFRPFVQSIHNASDWSLAGVEVLARWDHPTFGLLAPNAFLHIAKQLGVEADLDATMFSTALREMRAIETRGFRFPRISFNVSAGRLLDPTFQDIVESQTAYWDRRIAFEILETISLDDGGATLAQIKHLQAAGFEFDVDDFGSDHASINSVIEIAPSTVKIDRKIITPLGADPAAEAMVRTIVEMGKAMGVKITAEGIENEAQARIVNKLGGDKLQGYFFSRPMPVEEMVAHLSKQAGQTGQRPVRRVRH